MAKGPQAFRTISEAADELGVPQHVLRFWETRFSFIRPMKRAGGRRFYRPQDIAVLAGVQALLHRDGLSIKAVQALHREQGMKALLAASAAGPSSAPSQPQPHAEPPPAEPAAAVPEPDPLAADFEEPDLFAPPASAAAPPPAPRLNPEGRMKLAATLAGLEAIKARLDGLLEP